MLKANESGQEKKYDLIFAKGGGGKTSVAFKENKSGKWLIKFQRPNFFKRIMYRLGIAKDPRYNGKIGITHIAGVDPYSTKEYTNP